MLGQSPPKKSAPYDAWPMHFVHAIETALKVGLQRLKNKHPAADLHKADEHDITAWLQKELIDIAEDGVVPGYSPDVFQYPQLDSPTINHDGSSNKVRPDLRFYRQSQSIKVVAPLLDAWFCECKLIEENHSSRTYKNYQEKGIQRFVDGQYAWAMPHAQMIAYVRWPSASAATPLGPCYTALALASIKTDRDVCVTQHPRNHQINAQPATPIELRHIWFKFQ